MPHGQQNKKFCSAKQAKQARQYKKIKTKLNENNAAIWYNKTPDGNLLRVTYTRCRIDAIDSPDDEQSGARNM
jgi:hypothetical protein